MKGHSKEVFSGEFSADGNIIFTGSEDNTVKLWDGKTGKLISTTFTGSRKAYLSSHGNKLITQNPEYSSKFTLWRADLSSEIFNMDSLKIKGVVYAATISPDGEKFVAGTSDSSAKIWDLESKSVIRTLVHNSHVVAAFFSPDSKLLLTFAVKSAAMIWDVESGSVLTRFDNNDFEGPVFSRDSKKVVTISKRSSAFKTIPFAKVWDTHTGQLLVELKGHTSDITSIEFSPNGKKIVSASLDGTAKIWDAETGMLMKDLRGHQSYVNSARFSPDGRRIVTASSDYTAKVWDSESGMLLSDLTGSTFGVSSVLFSRDGRSLITSSGNYLMRVWDTQTGRVLKEFAGSDKYQQKYFSSDLKLIVTLSSTFGRDSKAEIWDAENGNIITSLKRPPKYATVLFLPDNRNIALTADVSTTIWDTKSGLLIRTLEGNRAKISPDGKKIATQTGDSVVRIWDCNSGRLLRIIKGHKIKMLSVAFSPDSKRIVTASGDNTARIWDVSTGVVSMILKGTEVWKGGLFEFSEKVRSAIFSPDGKMIFFTTWDNWVGIWNVEDGRFIGYLKETRHTITSNPGIREILFSPDGLKMAILSGETIKIWELPTLTLLSKIGEVSGGVFSPDGKIIVTESYDHTIKIWSAETGRLIYTDFVFANSGYLNLLPSGYYQCSPKAAQRLHYVTDSLEAITFEQLDIKYNRPDQVLMAIGCKDTTLISSAHYAYLKRIEHLKVDTSTYTNDYSIPIAEIVNKDELQQSGNQLALHITARDRLHNLDRVNVWINEVPIYGVKGTSLVNLNARQFDTTLIITLSAGSNRIEVSAVNSNGAESYHKPVFYFNSIKDYGRTYFFGIAIDHFANGQHTLSWSVNDIRSLARRLRERLGADCIIDTLFEENVTNDKLGKFKQLLQHTTVDDKVVIAYSGHGLLSVSYDFYLSSYDVDFNHPESSGIPYESLESLLDSIPARRKLVLLDACHSGKIDKSAAGNDSVLSNDLDIDALNELAQRRSNDQQKNAGIGNQRIFELMQQMFADVSRSTGSTIIASASASQYARAGDGNAVFTACVLECLKREHCSVSALKEYVNTRVPVLTKGMQVPTTRGGNVVLDWDLW